MPNIKPSLFIGIGSTGAEILGHLQELIVQEYLIEQFPVTRLLSFVTEESDGRKLRHTSRQQVTSLKVPSIRVVKDEVYGGTTKASKALKDWLPDEICLNQTKFENGSNAMRAAGKLHLWRNYEEIKARIKENVLACTNIESRKEAAQHLRSHLDINAADNDDIVESGLNIYVVGSLCGGTCSGMFLELGYILRSHPAIMALGDDHDVQIFGIFSVLNSTQAQDTQLELQSANCHAALSEFNYCYHENASAFPIILPDGEEIPRDHLPYDYFYLLSATSMEGESLVDGSNNYSHDAVHQMIAHNLFLDSYAGTYAIKQGMRTDWNSKVVPGDLDPIKRNPRAPFSFGCSMVTYPLYSIARASAGLIAKELCTEWLTPKGADYGKVINAGIKQLKQEVFPSLIQQEGMPSILENIISEIRLMGEFTSLRADVLHSRILDLPKPENSISKRFQEKGRYYDIVNNLYQEAVESKARNFVHSLIQSLRVDIDCRLPDVFEGIKRIRKELNKEKSLKKKRAVSPIFPLSRMNPLFDKARLVEKDFWLKVFGVRKQAIHERKILIRNMFEQLTREALGTLVAKFQIRVIDSALEELETIESDLNKEKKILSELADPINKGAGYFENETKRIVGNVSNPPRNIRYVLKSKDGTIDSELENIRSKVLDEDASNTMIKAISGKDINFSSEWTKSIIEWGKSNEIGDKILDDLTLDILRIVRNNGVDVLGEALKKWDSLKEIVSYASPYMEFTPAYLAGADSRLIPPNPTTKNSIFGDAANDNALETRLTGYIDPLRHQQGMWGYHSLQGVSHYLIFYQEEAYFSTTFMSASEGYEKAFKKHLDMNSPGTTILRWSDKRWFPSGPPIGDLDRSEYIDFLLNHSLDILSVTDLNDDDSDGDITDSLFSHLEDSAHKAYYFEVPNLHGIPERVYIGRKIDYLEKAKREIAVRFIPALVDKLTCVIQSLGSTPSESIKKFQGRYFAVKQQIDLARERESYSGTFSDSKKALYNDKIARLDAYFLHVRELTWRDKMPTEQERQTLRKFSWLIDWVNEDY